MALTQDYEDLAAWRKSLDLAVAVYLVTNLLPTGLHRPLHDRLRVAALAVVDCVADGQQSLVTSELQHRVTAARLSLQEIDVELRLAVRLRYLRAGDLGEVRALTVETGRLLSMLSAKASARRRQAGELA